MLTIARLRPSSAARGYYTAAARADADWQEWTGIPASEWIGAARGELGRDGPVAGGELARLLLGTDPASGHHLRRTAPARTVARLRIDPATGTLHQYTEHARPVAGFDLVFSAPKSISLMFALAGAAAGGVAGAHRQAWSDALEMLESHACIVRRGGAGVTGIGFVGAAFAHYTNRDGDPHLHTHVVIANQTRSGDEPGRWRALDALPLLVGWRRAAGAVYEARLRFELTMRFGCGWRRRPGGGIELAAIDEAAIRAASRRADEVRAHARSVGVHTAHGARIAGRVARPARRDFACAAQRARWRVALGQLGLDEATGARLIGAGRVPVPCDAERTDLELVGQGGLTATAQTFTRADLITAWADAAREGATGRVLQARADRTALLPELACLAPARPGRPARFATVEIIAAETSALTRAAAGRGLATQRATPEDVATALIGAPVALTAEQAAAAEHAAAAGDQVACIVGRAGSGKTTALAVAARAMWASGIPVTGCAPSAQAAHVLGTATGMPTATMHALLGRWDTGLAGAAGCVIVDEASMADTRTLERLLARCARDGARVVLVGDPRQLPAVGPGGLFCELARRLGAVELNGNLRQDADWERTALAALRTGDARGALEALVAHGRVHPADDAVAACARMWWEDSRSRPEADTLMIAYRRSEVAALNGIARQRREAAGLRGDRLGSGARQFAVGDTLRCRINDPRLGLRNGMRGTVGALDTASGSLVVDIDDGTRVEIPRAYRLADGVEHAWAITGHAAQGITVERAWVIAPGDGAHAEWGYVALSRARSEVHLVVGRTPEDDEMDVLARALTTASAQPPAVVMRARRLHRTGPDPPPPVPEPSPRNHKRALTRDRTLSR